MTTIHNRRKRSCITISLLLCVLCLVILNFTAVGYAKASTINQNNNDFEKEPFSEEIITAHDPLEPINRFFFEFNDKLYFWVLKPVTTVYKTFLPPGVRTAIKNAFENIRTPIRFFNCLLQKKGKPALIELERFFINSTLGVGGFFDIAKTHFNLQKYSEDFGQTLAVHGMKADTYIDWPIFGPSTIRDTIGKVLDLALDPLSYMPGGLVVQAEVRTGKIVNDTSFVLGEYEDLKESAVDPYVALRNAYLQHRKKLIEE